MLSSLALCLAAALTQSPAIEGTDAGIPPTGPEIVAPVSERVDATRTLLQQDVAPTVQLLRTDEFVLRIGSLVLPAGSYHRVPKDVLDADSSSDEGALIFLRGAVPRAEQLI